MRTQTIEVRVGRDITYHQGVADHHAESRTSRKVLARESAEKRLKHATREKTRSMVAEYRAAWRRIRGSEGGAA